MRLRVLRDCFVVYDYCSFPQDRDPEKLSLVLENMTHLIRNVVILASDGYANRGWCLYEYLAATLQLSMVCDEIKDPDFVELLRWNSTEAPVNLSLKGHSHDAHIQNAINKGILDAVNRIRPRYIDSKFTVDQDREIVTKLLTEMLLRVLPGRREYPNPYLGEWVNKPWSREELELIFTDKRRSDAKIDELEYLGTTHLKPNRVYIPSTIEEAALKNYVTSRRKRMGYWESIWRVWEALLSEPLLRLAEWENKSFRNRAVIWLITRAFSLALLIFVTIVWVYGTIGWVYGKTRRED